MSRVKDLTNMKFGRLTVLQRAENDKQGRAMWICKCECGNITKPIKAYSLTSGNTRSCGCLHNEELAERRFKDLTGQRFGRLTVVKRADIKRKHTYWLCRCDCGNEIPVIGDCLINGHTQSCGCLNKELSKERAKEMWQQEGYKEAHSGENHRNYNPDLTDEDRQDRRCQEGYNEWNYKVKEGANFTCDICGKRHGNIVSHHLDGYNWCREKRTDIANGVCLCESCHKEFHKLYGKGDNTKEQYIEFKENKLTKQEQ